MSSNARMFEMRFPPSKCKLLLQDWSASTPELRIESEVVERVDNFTYLGSLISPNGLVSDEIPARIRKARLAFANLRHLWRRRDIRLSIKKTSILRSSPFCFNLRQRNMVIKSRRHS
ncbi:unnamed protein product [Schistosoma margrebowiei]|uniref:Reverse transcriptase domain-containing protein n=1 Tax=Schistosoma margrebowiei TaxID=48269 RepID=A0A3P7W444_9TREM|nr:unnamed protein product [Schistosoma margrebowiei]